MGCYEIDLPGNYPTCAQWNAYRKAYTTRAPSGCIPSWQRRDSMTYFLGPVTRQIAGLEPYTTMREFG